MERKCNHCDEVFEFTRLSARFCSDKCRKALKRTLGGQSLGGQVKRTTLKGQVTEVMEGVEVTAEGAVIKKPKIVLEEKGEKVMDGNIGTEKLIPEPDVYGKLKECFIGEGKSFQEVEILMDQQVNNYERKGSYWIPVRFNKKFE